MNTQTGALLLCFAAQAQADPRLRVSFLPPRPSTPRSPDTTLEPNKKNPEATESSATVAPLLHARMVTLFNVHTREALALEEAPVADEEQLVARLLRDRTTWEEHPISMACIDVIRRVAATHSASRAEIVSGFRSDKLNEHLRKKGHHVASQSQHVQGQAIDFRLVGVPTTALLRSVRATHHGGVGSYPSSGFVHIDTGPARQWRGE